MAEHFSNAIDWILNAVEQGQPQPIVAVGVDDKNIDLIRCPLAKLRNVGPTLAQAIELNPVVKGVCFRVFTTQEAFNAAMRMISGEHAYNLELDANTSIDLFTFVWDYKITGLKQESRDLCLSLNFDQIEASCLIKLHYTFFNHNIWPDYPAHLDELFRAISCRGSEVIVALSKSTAMCVDTVLSIISLVYLNVFSEKEVYDAIRMWRDGVMAFNTRRPEILRQFGMRYATEILKKIRFDYFTAKETNNFLFNEPDPCIDFQAKISLLKENEENTSEWDVNAGKNRELPVISILRREITSDGLNFGFLSQWRGYFFPFTERTVLLKPKAKTLDEVAEEDNQQNFAIRPLKIGFYLLNIKLFNLEGLQADESMNVRLLIEVIRTLDNAIVSKTFFDWKPNESHQCRLVNPCLLEGSQTYQIKVTNLEAQNEFQNYFEVSSDDQGCKDELFVSGKGNICGFEYAFA